MPLVPAKGDPRRAQEIARRLRDPGSFGVTEGDGSKQRKTRTQLLAEQGKIQLHNPNTDRMIILPDDFD